MQVQKVELLLLPFKGFSQEERGWKIAFSIHVTHALYVSIHVNICDAVVS